MKERGGEGEDEQVAFPVSVRVSGGAGRSTTNETVGEIKRMEERSGEGEDKEVV